MAKEKTKVVGDDYSTAHLPATDRKHMVALIAILAGFALNSSEVISGGTIVLPLGFKLGFLALLIGTAVDAGIAALMTVPAQKHGLTFSLQTRYVFGLKGTKLPSAIIAVCYCGWFGVLQAFLARGIVYLYPSLDFLPVCIITGLLMTVIAIIGVNALAIVGYLAVPIVLVTGVLGINRLTDAYPIVMDPDGSVTFFYGVSQAIAACITGALVICDVSRYGKTTKQGVVGILLGMFFGLGFCRVVGGISALTTGTPDIIRSLGAVGLIIPAFLFLLFNVVSTQDGHLYSLGLALSNIFNWKRTILTLIAGVIGTAIATMGLVDHWGAWLNFIGSFVPPLGGVMIAHYYYTMKSKYGHLDDITCQVNWIAIASWAIGTLVAIVAVWVPALEGLIAGAIAHIILTEIVKRTKPDYYLNITNTPKDEELVKA